MVGDAGGECVIDLTGRVLGFYSQLVDTQMDKSVCIVAPAGTCHRLWL